MSNNMPGLTLRAAHGPINTLLERLGGSDGELWLSRLNKFNRGQNPFATMVDGAKLAIVAGATVVVAAIRTPSATAFAAKAGDVASPFGYRDLLVALKFWETKKFIAQGYDLRREMAFAEMIEAAGGEGEIRKKHLFTRDQVRVFVDQQTNGEAGPLLVNGDDNFFFTLADDGRSLAVVSVYWFADNCFWCVRSYSASRDNRCRAGYRLFLRAA